MDSIIKASKLVYPSHLDRTSHFLENFVGPNMKMFAQFYTQPAHTSAHMHKLIQDHTNAEKCTQKFT